MSNRVVFVTIFAAALFACSLAQGATLNLQTSGSTTTLRIDNDPPFHSTQSTVMGATLLEVAGTSLLLVHWQETPAGGSPVPYYAFSYNGQFSYVRRTDYLLRLLVAEFDPVAGTPSLPASLQADAAGRMHVVQFVTQPLQELENGVINSGGIIRGPLRSNADVVEMSAQTAATVGQLPYVRAVVPFHPAYRLENYLRDNWSQGATLFPLQRYNIAVFEPGVTQKNAVAARIQSIGGTVNVASPNGFLLIATLTYSQLQQVIRWDEVAFADRWMPPVQAMDNARAISGANILEGVKGFSGQGVRGEIMDLWVQLDHPAFRGVCVAGSSAGTSCSTDAACPGGTCDGEPIVHGVDGSPIVAEQEYHGTKVHGCLFGDGTGSTIPGAKGMIPDAQSIVASLCTLTDYAGPASCQGVTAPQTDRDDHIAQLVNTTYRAVFQSNSWGSNRDGLTYTNRSVNLDNIVNTYDILICQAQGNADRVETPQQSLPEAWCKNVVSVGGVIHNNNTIKSDDIWGSASCIGPAADGRIKPDLVHFYDAVYTTANDGGYANFSGTSAATPITCGHFGLFFQMWYNGVFPVFGGGAPPLDVFDTRPHASTAKAMMINTAEPYRFYDLPGNPAPNPDLTRDRQGWGLPSVGKLYKLRGQFPLIVNETTVLTFPASELYFVTVPPNLFSLKATLVYSDRSNPPYSPATTNDLDLKVTSPSGTVYWGNYGLRSSNWSPPWLGQGDGDDLDANGTPGKIFDTVENVFILTPIQAGTWQVLVRTGQIMSRDNPARNAKFALVVSFDYDCNGNSISDADEISRGEQEDFDDNGVPDVCQRLYHVNPSGSGTDGLSWPTGFAALQTAIDHAVVGDRIIVKSGDYGPVTLKNGVAVYGGFAGVVSETSPSQANYRVNVTNIVGNGSSPHVVLSTNNNSSTILRGFHIKNGNANGSGNDAHGGGLLLENSNAKIVQCVFTNNDAVGNGAAVANVKRNAQGVEGSPIFVNCTFHRNKDVGIPTGDILKGGAVYSEGGNPQFVNCLFHKNEARDGGAVYVEAGQPKFFNCTISDNVATNNGGGVFDRLGLSTVRNGILYFNTATSGSQIRNDSGATVVTYSDVQGGWTGAGNITGLPRFTDRFADDYTLNVSATPCDDVGRNTDVPADTADIDWDNNITELVPKDLAAPATSGGVAVDRRFGGNCTVDMGALEIQGSCSIP